MFFFRTFQSRLLFFIAGFYILAQVLAFLAVDAASRFNARSQINAELASGGRVFDWVMQSRSERFLDAAQIISADLGFKIAYGSKDRSTLLAAMKNHATRVKADLMLLLSPDHTVIADTQHPKAGPASFLFPRLIEAAERSGKASAMAFYEGHLYRFVVVPLRAPIPVAWVVVGHTIDDALARQFKMLTSLEVTFVVEQGKDRVPVTAASTLGGALRRELEAALPSAAWQPGGKAEFTLQRDTYLGLSRELGVEAESQVTVLLQRSLDTALQPFDQLRRKLITLFGGGLAVLLAGGLVISARVTKPVRMLAESAHSIEQGDYTRVLTVDRQDELGRLSNAFNIMQEAIKQREEQIRYHASYDPLTGLPNRSYLHQRLSGALADARANVRPLAVIVMNIDRFIDVVAALGHEAGNSILQNIGPLLLKAVPGSSLVARIGGDEFAMLLAGGESAQGAVRIVQDIQKKLETPFWVGNAPVQIEARFGIAAYPAHGADADTLLRLGEVASHLAKQSPSGYSIYSSELDHRNLRHLTLLAELRHAIDNDEIMLFYQPKVDFATCRVTGAEALIRWQHSQHGFISPDEFIRLSEGTGLIKPVTNWTLKTAISQCAELKQHGISINMGINLSARVLPDHQLPDLVSSLLDVHHVPPGQITLEVTESAIMSDSARTLDVITRLDSTGVHLCVDDFGTGYSSLSYLKRLPVDELKIDKSFVQMMDTNQNDEIIVHSIIELAHNLGLKVTAEGVENQQVWEMLKSRGCDVAQGYLHGKPMPLDEFIAWSERSPWGLGRRP
jgi:diguanylate cyclase (GGDEF)-like protein